MSAFDRISAREESWRKVKTEGLQSNPELPLLDSDLKVHQSVEAIGTRILCMSATAAHAFGFPLSAVRAWIDQERLRSELSRAELKFLSGSDQENLLAMQMQVHSVYTLAWCVSLVDDFSVHREMPDDPVTRLPDLKKAESSGPFRANLVLRPTDEILTQLDLAYCFHWAWRDSRLSLKPLRVNKESLVSQRRKALEWVMKGGTWDEVPLDT